MRAPPDFDFCFGKDRHLRCHGWRGLLALSIFLMALTSVAYAGSPSVRLLLYSLR